MTRDELIDRLAEIEYQRGGSWYPRKPLWDEMTEDQKRHARANVERYLPVIVACVANWLEGQEAMVFDESGRPESAVEAWREEMGE